jgi:hypothetical protein
MFWCVDGEGCTRQGKTAVAIVLTIALLTPPFLPVAFAGAQGDGHSIVGVWSLNKELSDTPPERPQSDSQGRRGGNRGNGGGGGRFGGGGGGFGRGNGGGRGGGQDAGDADAMRRRMEAMREILAAPERLTITRTDSLVIITTGDGRTTRLSPDGKKIKDESTGIERKTRWDNDKLVTEITGAGRGKITETYAADAELHRLTVSVQAEDSRMPNGGVMHRVYGEPPK